MSLVDLTRIATALRHCGRVKAFNPGRAFHSNLMKLGLTNNVYIANNLISMYSGLHDLRDARKVFDEMPSQNIVTWTTMVSAYTDGGRPSEALRLYDHMLESKLETPNGFMYSAALKACGALGDFKLGKSIHDKMIGAGFDSDTVLVNTLLDMYVKCGSLSDANEVFNEVSVANSTTWNTMISGHAKAGLMKEAVNLFRRMPNPNVVSWNTVVAGFADKGSICASEFVCEMHREGLRLDGFTFPCALKTCGLHGLLDFGKQIHSYAIKSGFESDCFTMSALVDMYSVCKELIAASKLFLRYSKRDPTSVWDSLAVWNSMLSGYVINERNAEALEVVSLIHSSSVSMDSYTFSGALKACTNSGNLRVGRQVHCLVVTYGYQSDHVVGSILVDLYARLGRVEDALGLFHGLPRKDTVAWSGLISGCARTGLNWLAFSLFRDMIQLNVEVDQFVTSSVVKVCSSLTSLRSGKQIHGFCTKKGYESEGVITTSLIDMYAKCGEIEDGLALFECVKERDVVCWTGIIVGCGQNGRASEAIKFFEEMKESGLKPNEVTYLGVLSACRHGGLAKEARKIFSSMRLEDGLEPCLEHYNCMVDLLSLSGSFDEAKDLIAEMPCQPNHTVWRSLLGACGTHGNNELVNIIDKDLLAKSSEDSSTYVTLSNVYAELGMWDDLSRVRKFARELGSKEAGKSWIEISS